MQDHESMLKTPSICQSELMRTTTHQLKSVLKHKAEMKQQTGSTMRLTKKQQELKERIESRVAKTANEKRP